VFNRLFAAPVEGDADTLIIVAHNNIILYLLMRAAGVPIERAAQAWCLFQLCHASITRVDVMSSGVKQIVSIGGSGHISDATATWNNITGEDMAAWKGGKPERRKMSGRMIVLVRQASSNTETCNRQTDAVVARVAGLSDYMMSGHITVTSTVGAQPPAVAVARRFRTMPKLFPDSIAEHPEAAFSSLFCASERSRDTVVIVAEDSSVLYWLLRALHMSPEDAKAMAPLYRIGHASVTLVNMRADGSTKVVAVGDTGHIPLEST